MATINELDFRRVDLNLLPVFLVLMKERNLTRAAARLALGQPAVSAALRRLREALGDELFVRQQRGIAPTARAIDLEARLRPLLESLWSSLHEPRVFDPARANVSFRMGMTDDHEHFLMPRLLPRLLKEAPGVRIAVRSASGVTASRMLDDGDIELYCGRIDEVPAWQRREPLGEIDFLCLYSAARLKVAGPLTTAQFLAAPHLLVSFKGEFEGSVDRALARHGRRRRVVLAAANFATLPAVLAQVGAVATLPSHSALRFARDYKLTTCPPPIKIEKFWTVLAWLAKNDKEPALAWLRQTVRECVADTSKAK